MNRDRVKTFLLTFLVVSSLLLAGRIWFSEKLWSNDYNFFAKWKNQKWVQEILNKIPLFSPNESNIYILREYVFRPYKIIVNLGEYNTVFYEGSGEFDKFKSIYNVIFETILSGSGDFRRTTVDSDEWFNVLGAKEKYFFVNYNISCNTKTVGQIMGIKDSPLASSTPRFKELIIIPGDNVSSDITVYIKSVKDKTINKYFIRHDKLKLLAFLEDIDLNTVQKYFFSFEKDLDKKKNNKTVINSEVLIPLSKIDFPIIRSYTTFKPENNQILEEIINVFGYSINTLRQYKEKDNTVVYVENNSTLKVAPEGIVEYRAVEQGKGLRLYNNQMPGEKNIFYLYESLVMAIDLMEKTGALNKNLHITSDILENSDKPGVYRFTFGYFINGIPVLIKMDDNIVRHAVEIEITNGTLNYYKEYKKSYDTKQMVQIDIPLLQALDGYLSKLDVENDINVKDIFLGYVDNGSKTLKNPHWNILLEGTKEIYSISAVK